MTNRKKHASPQERLACYFFVAFALISSVVFTAACDLGSGEPATPNVTTTPLSPTLAEGRTVFLTSCNKCHPSGRMGTGPDIRGDRYSDTEIMTTVRNGKRLMPAFPVGVISDAQLQNVIGYLRTLR